MNTEIHQIKESLKKNISNSNNENHNVTGKNYLPPEDNIITILRRRFAKNILNMKKNTSKD